MSNPLLLRVYALYASDFHLSSLCVTRSDISPPAAIVVAPKIRNECRANSSRFRPDFTIISLIARSARPYLTTQTDLPLRYEEREGCVVGKTRKKQFQHKGNGTTVYPKERLRIVNLGPCPHAYASHLFLITLMAPPKRTSNLSSCRHRMYCNCVSSA